MPLLFLSAILLLFGMVALIFERRRKGGAWKEIAFGLAGAFAAGLLAWIVA